MPEVELREPQWLTTGQAGRLIGVSDDTIVRYIRQGGIKATRTPGGRYRINRTDLIRFLKKYKFEVEL